MKILLVDDDPIQRAVAEKFLRAQGNIVTCVESGEAAVAAVEATTDEHDQFDQVFMDMRMPGIGGQEAALRIRKLPDSRGNVRIIAMSAAELPPDAPAARYDGFLPKGPDFNHALAAAVAEGIARSQPAPPQPPRETLISWLRLNLMLTAAICSATSFLLGAAIAGTLRVGRFDDRLKAIEATQPVDMRLSVDLLLAHDKRRDEDKPEHMGPRVTELEASDKRRDDQVTDRDNRRIEDRRVMNERFDALDGKLKWVFETLNNTKVKK